MSSMHGGYTMQAKKQRVTTDAAKASWYGIIQGISPTAGFPGSC